MSHPNLNEERKLWRKGYKKVVGLDEAGRGPLCGPVVAGAVLLNSKLKFKIQNLKIKDSKKLTAKKREEFYKILINRPDVEWKIGIVSEKVIDRINILEATKLAMEKAVKGLKRKVDFLILDGNFKINLSLPQKPIIKGDEKVFSCAAASILAKVTRDRIMMRYDKKYPLYGFAKHKGYPTRRHLKMLKKFGPCKIHRKTFGPVREIDNY